MTTEVECVITNGGPLIALPGERVAAWGGTDNDDYDRACDVPDESVLVGDGHSVWTLAGPQRDEADGGVLELQLAPGHYRIRVACPVERMTFIRLERDREP